MYRHANGQGSMTPNEEGIWLWAVTKDTQKTLYFLSKLLFFLRTLQSGLRFILIEFYFNYVLKHFKVFL